MIGQNSLGQSFVVAPDRKGRKVGAHHHHGASGPSCFPPDPHPERRPDWIATTGSGKSSLTPKWTASKR